MSCKGFLLIGAGGHAKVVLEALEQHTQNKQIIVFSDKGEKAGLMGRKVNLGRPTPENFPPSDWLVHVAIGDNIARETTTHTLAKQGYHFKSVIHSSACISPSVSIGNGVAILANATLTAEAVIKDGVIINTSAVIEHDCEIAEFTHICPGAVIAGGTKIGKRCFIGANSTVRQMLKFQNDVTLGQHSMAVKSLTEKGIYIGTPAKLLKET